MSKKTTVRKSKLPARTTRAKTVPAQGDATAPASQCRAADIGHAACANAGCATCIDTNAR